MSPPASCRCRFCGWVWLAFPQGWAAAYKAKEPLPGKDLKCPSCGLDGSTVVMTADPNLQLSLL